MAWASDVSSLSVVLGRSETSGRHLSATCGDGRSQSPHRLMWRCRTGSRAGSPAVSSGPRAARPTAVRRPRASARRPAAPVHRDQSVTSPFPNGAGQDADCGVITQLCDNSLPMTIPGDGNGVAQRLPPGLGASSPFYARTCGSGRTHTQTRGCCRRGSRTHLATSPPGRGRPGPAGRAWWTRGRSTWGIGAAWVSVPILFTSCQSEFASRSL